MAAPKKVDYERIEPGWRAGLKSPAQLASEYTEETGINVSRAAIIKHFTKLDIPRNLDAKVHAKADAMVAQDMFTGKLSTDTKRRDSEIVGLVATEVATIRISHRTDIQRSKRIANSLLEHLESLGLPKFPEGDRTESELQAARALSIGTLKDQSAILDKLVGTQKVLVAMEREAFGIAQMVESPEAPATANPMDVARRIAFGLARAGSQLTQQ